jgi:hypothetical protein
MSDESPAVPAVANEAGDSRIESTEPKATALEASSDEPALDKDTGKAPASKDKPTGMLCPAEYLPHDRHILTSFSTDRHRTGRDSDGGDGANRVRRCKWKDGGRACSRRVPDASSQRHTGQEGRQFETQVHRRRGISQEEEVAATRHAP